MNFSGSGYIEGSIPAGTQGEGALENDHTVFQHHILQSAALGSVCKKG